MAASRRGLLAGTRPRGGSGLENHRAVGHPSAVAPGPEASPRGPRSAAGPRRTPATGENVLAATLVAHEPSRGRWLSMNRRLDGSKGSDDTLIIAFPGSKQQRRPISARRVPQSVNTRGKNGAPSTMGYCGMRFSERRVIGSAEDVDRPVRPITTMEKKTQRAIAHGTSPGRRPGRVTTRARKVAGEAWGTHGTRQHERLYSDRN